MISNEVAASVSPDVLEFLEEFDTTIERLNWVCEVALLQMPEFLASWRVVVVKVLISGETLSQPEGVYFATLFDPRELVADPQVRKETINRAILDGLRSVLTQGK